MASKPVEFLLQLHAFAVVLLLSPLVGFSYLVVKLSQSFWFNIISFLHPDVQFIRGTTLRTMSDTHRNQGIIAVLLSVRGPADSDAVKRHLQGVIERTDKLGGLMFPHLKESLVARCGTYAWKAVDGFDLDQNLILAPTSFKGRAISDFNIQDCVSDIVSKYLPSGVPPWQMVIIPSTEHQHYILLRLHHVLLTDQLTIAEVLPLKPAIRYNIEAAKSQTPLRNVFRKPEHIPELKERLTEDVTNAWNEFISNYDPLERLELLKTQPGFFQFLAILLITFVSILREYSKGIQVVKTDIFSQLKFLVYTTKRESEKRKVSLGTFFGSIFLSMQPKSMVSVALRNIWVIFWALTVRLPVRIYCEINALYSCLVLQYCAHPRTTIGLIYNYVPLLFNAAKEVLYCLGVVFKAPKNILDEMCASQDIVQTVTLCGRKVVAWSPPVKALYVKDIAQRANLSEAEVVLAACSAGIANYFEKMKDVPPKEIAITARNINSNYIFGKDVQPRNTIGGMLCLDLPILDVRKGAAPEDNLKRIGRNVARALDKQPLTYLLSILQTRQGVLSKLFPATSIGIFLRCLSLKYSVCFTEVTTKTPNVRQQTVWGSEVISAIYWRPPQANISISLCLNQYADHVTLGVMSDAQLAPHHPALVRNFPDYLDDLASAVGAH